MASRRKEHQEDAKLRVLHLIDIKPQITTREAAKKVGISDGSAYYLLTALIDKGFVRVSNLEKNLQKIKYTYSLTPKGIREKSIITNKFLHRKKLEFEALKEEINTYEKSIGNDLDNKE